jgi:arylsulfate sulfotransferase
MKKIKKQKKTPVVILVIILIILVALIFLQIRNIKLTNRDKIKETKSMVTNQAEYERDFDSKGYTFDNPKVLLNPYKVSPLTALVMFETENDCSVKITIKGKDDLTTYTNTFSKAKSHYIPVYGLYADYENKVILECGTNKKELTIKTDKLPDNFVLPTSVKKDTSKLTNDLYFYTPSAKGYTLAYDVNGDVRWYLTSYALWDNTRLKNGHMLISTERLINTPYYMTGLYEIDLLGKIYNEYSIKGGYHHDYFELPSGNLLVASNDFGNKNGTVEDYVVELDRKTGKIVKTFDLKNILNMNDGKSENWIEYDWFHNNSVWYDAKTDSITLSGRHQDAVINISYKTGKLNWIIGDRTSWSKEYQKYFFKPIGDNFEWQWSQHAAMITPEGYVFIFDNGNNKSKIKENYVSADKSYSRGVMYEINTKNMTIKQVYEYGKERGSKFYSPYISDVDYIDSNHYIVHSGGIVEVDGISSNKPAGLTSGNTKLTSDTVEVLDNKVIFELVLPTNNYRVEKMSLYSNSDELKIKSAKRLGSLGKKNVTKNEMLSLYSVKKQDNEYKKHNIKLVKEEDRLSVTGKFKRGSDINVILYKNLKSSYYKINVSKHPYTALCVDVFTEEENKNGIMVTKYINSEGLSGTYSVYISINGKVYNTNKSVEF